MPSWPGERSACASARGDFTCSVGAPLPFVEASSEPSQNVTRNGRSGRLAASSRRSGSVVRRAAMGYVWMALRACFSGLTRTTSHARPNFSSVQITPAEMSSCQALSPWR